MILNERRSCEDHPKRNRATRTVCLWAYIVIYVVNILILTVDFWPESRNAAALLNGSAWMMILAGVLSHVLRSKKVKWFRVPMITATAGSIANGIAFLLMM